MPWYRRFGPILPVLAAEAGLWLGFGAILPILPLWITRQGIDFGTLGLIVAAWPLARLIAEPIFGWVADRRDRRAMMILGLVLTSVVAPLPLLAGSAAAFFVLRFLAGVATAMYDPAARGFIVDTVDPHERGHAFGLFATAQMGGFILGPAVGAVGAAIVQQATGSEFAAYAFPFVFCSASLVLAAVPLAVVTRRASDAARAAAAGGTAGETAGATGPVADDLPTAAAGPGTPAAPAAPAAPASIWNRVLLGAMIINVGALLGAGTYEVIWSLWLKSLGADLALIGFSFTIFGVGMIVLSPFAGKMIDRTGPLRFVVIGTIASAGAALVYPAMTDPWVVTFVSVFEGVGIAVSGPALYTIVGRGTPRGRSSTAQGLFGASGTMGFILASLAAGSFFEIAPGLPFYAMAAGMAVTLVLGIAVGGRALAGRPDPATATSVPALAPNS